MNKKILRLKLTDFINTDIETNVVQFLHTIKDNTPTFTVECWYDRGDITQKDIDKFKLKYSEYLDSIEMSFYSLSSYESAVWYDIIHTKDELSLTHYKFRSVYNNTDEIINCILEFNNVIKFDSQKTGYNKNGFNKNAKDSNNRFKKVGRQG